MSDGAPGGTEGARIAPRWLLPGVVAAAFLFFAAALPGRGLWHNDEHRYVEVARFMTTPAGDVLVPHLNGEIYPDKPPLFFWIVAAIHGATGMDLAAAGRIPSALAGALAVAAVCAIGRRLWGTRAGVAAAVVLATTSEFWWLSVRANLDALMTGLMTLGVAAFARAVFPLPGERERPALFGALAFLAVGVGSFVKGPASLVLPAASVGVFALLVRDRRVTLSFLWGVPLALLPLVAWLVASGLHAGWGYVHDIAFGQWFGHPMGQVDKVEPWWFYAKALPVTLLPWTLLVPAALFALVRWRRSEERRADVFLACWVGVQLLLLSFSKAKRDLYLTPVMPATALLVGRLARDLLDGPPERLRHGLVAFGRFSIVGIALLAGLAAVAGGVASLAGFDERLLGRWPAWHGLRPAATTAIALGAVVAGLAIVESSRRAILAKTAEGAARWVGTSVAGILLAAGLVVFPVLDRGRSSRPFAEAIAPIVKDAPLADYGGTDFAPNWILRRDVVKRLQDVGEVRNKDEERRRRAQAFLAAAGDGPAFLVVDRGYLDRNGLPDRMTIVLAFPRALDDDLVLLGRAPR